MKRFYLLLLITTYTVMQLSAQSGYVSEKLKMNSTILGMEVAYSIYLPADYNSSDIDYPVLYLLHGYTDDHTAWIQFGQMNRILDDCINKGTAPSMIVIMPDAGVSFYINSADNKVRYEDMFVKEFIPFIEKTYRIRQKKEFRAIAGLSMGGYGSLIYALKYPELFAVCCPLSAAIYTDENVTSMADERYKALFSVFDQHSSTRLTEHWYQNSVLHLIENMDDNKKNDVRFYIDCGDDDRLSEGNALMHILMSKKGIPHEFRIRDGKHNWGYWRTALPEVFQFIGNSFNR